MELWRSAEAAVLVEISPVVYISNIVFGISRDLISHKNQQGFFVFFCLRISWKPGFYSACKEKSVCYVYIKYITITMYTNYRGHSIEGDWLTQIVKSLNGLLVKFVALFTRLYLDGWFLLNIFLSKLLWILMMASIFIILYL